MQEEPALWQRSANLAGVEDDPAIATLRQERRIRGVLEVLSFGMLAGMLLSPKLWLSARAYPLAPVVDFAPVVAPPFDALWFVALLGLLVAIALAPRPRTFVLLFVTLAMFVSLGDQTRWQPWFYQYLCMLAALGLAGCWSSEGASEAIGLNACRLIVASTYFWSGCQKLNYAFQHEVYPLLIEPFRRFLPDSMWFGAQAASLAPPLLEAVLGIGLLVPILRPLAIGLALAMHALILLSIGPLGLNWNSVVWPWNIAMIFLVVRLFGGTRNVSFLAMVWPARSLLHGMTILLFCVMPLFSFRGLWDAYLSAALYSGNTLKGEVVIAEEVFEKLPPDARNVVHPGDNDDHKIDLAEWAMKELNVPPYPARRVYRRLAWRLGTLAGKPTTVILIIQERPDILTGKRVETKARMEVK